MNRQVTKILAAIDFSDTSLNALETAASLAVKCRAFLYILYAHDNILEFMGVNTITVKSVDNNASDILAGISNDIGKKFTIGPIIVEHQGQANEAILKTAVKYQCDLIVMGSCGASGFRKGYLGSTAYNMIKYAICPVLLIPPGKTVTHFKKPLYPVRPVATAFMHYEVIQQLLEKESTLNILGLYYPGEDDKLFDINDLVSKIKPRLKLHSFNHKIELCDTNSMPQNVLSSAEMNQSDLIIISPATDLAIKPFYIGPRTHYITQNAKVPLLVINKPARFSVPNQRTSL